MGLYDSYVLQLEKGSACKEQITPTKTELTNQRPCLYNHCPIKAAYFMALETPVALALPTCTQAVFASKYHIILSTP